MPIYEYRCEACGQDFEYLVLGQSGPESCPQCKSDRLNRLMSTCAFTSKGAGGETVSSSAGSSCGSCASTNCGSCGH